jgi:hypothetical protein
LFNTKLAVAPPTSTVTGRPRRDVPAPIVSFPFHSTVSAAVFLKFSLMIAFFSCGVVMGAS